MGCTGTHGLILIMTLIAPVHQILCTPLVTVVMKWMASTSMITTSTIIIDLVMMIVECMLFHCSGVVQFRALTGSVTVT